MPDVARLRFIGPEPVHVAVLGRQVDPDCVVDVPGSVEELDDCYVIDPGGDGQARAWPKSMWKDETVTKRARKAATEEIEG